ncbi:hypothetical protein JW926_00675 [Candidatus Sumerlaeota bacterium]|nr:hypothetical protein [Candidatus Sumerlaeota bacterium]
MKTLTPISEELRKNSSKDAFWLFDLELPDGIRRFASRPLTIGNRIYEPAVMNINAFYQETPEGEAIGKSRLVLEIDNSPTSGPSRLQYLDNLYGIEGRKGSLSVFFRDAEGVSGENDIILLGDFIVSEIAFSPIAATLSLVDHLSHAAERYLCRKADSLLLPGISGEDNDDLFLPVVFGKIENHPLLLLPFSKALDWQTSIIGELVPEAIYATLADVSPLPEKGRAQIGDEVLEYRIVNRALGTIGSTSSPLIRSEAGYHADGTTVRFLPEDGLYYLVADHPCKSVTRVSSNERILDESDYAVVSKFLGEREVCEVHLERYPCLVQTASGASILRMEEQRYPGCFGVKEGGTALFPERAIDSFPGVTSAILDAAHQDLLLQFNENLRNGMFRYGNLVRCGIEIICLSTPGTGNRSPFYLEVKKGVSNKMMKIYFPGKELLKAAVPSQNLLVSGILDSGGVASLAFPENSLLIKFDEVSGEMNLGGGNYKWKDAHLAKDDNFGANTTNFTGEGIESNDQPLVFRICRRAMLDDAAKPTRALLHAVMDSCGSPPKNAVISMRIADRFNGSGSFCVDGSKKEYIYETPLQNVNFEHLVDTATYFSIHVPDGSQLRVYETWLEIRYALNPPEIDPEKIAEIQGMEGEFSSLDICLPTPMISHYMDITGLVKANGDWEFFSGEENAPSLSISFSGKEESIHITNTALVLEYLPRVKEIQTADLAATVEGIHEEGVLLENPADMVRHILISENFLDFSESDIDEISFERVKTYLSNSNQIHHGCYTRDIAALEAMDRIMRESGIRLLCEGGKFRLLPPLWNPRRIGESLETVDLIDDALLLETKPVMKREKVSPVERIGITTPLETIRLECGDRICLNHERALMDRAWGEVVSWEMKSPDQIQMELSPLETGAIFWEHDQESLLRQISGGKGIMFYINKKAVARLEKSGNLFLMGELWEKALSEQVLSSMIEFEETGARILFGAGEENVFPNIFGFDANGCLFTKGEVVEGVLPFSIVPGEFVKSTIVNGEFYVILSADGINPLLIGERTSGRIYIKGELLENVK